MLHAIWILIISRILMLIIWAKSIYLIYNRLVLDGKPNQLVGFACSLYVNLLVYFQLLRTFSVLRFVLPSEWMTLSSLISPIIHMCTMMINSIFWFKTRCAGTKKMCVWIIARLSIVLSNGSIFNVIFILASVSKYSISKIPHCDRNQIFVLYKNSMRYKTHVSHVHANTSERCWSIV